MKASDVEGRLPYAETKALNPTAPAPVSGGSKATVPVNDGGVYTFANSAAPKLNYPEPGLSTSWTVASQDAANHVYKIVVTTTFPASDAVGTYVETYFVQDRSAGGATPDDAWTIDDPIVKETSPGVWAEDEGYRLSQIVNFRDGSVRSETTVSDSNSGGGKFAAFALGGALDFDTYFYPAADATASYSSVTVYEQTPATTYNYSFWTGTETAKIFGVRYYTEHKTATTLTASTILFEKALSTLETAGGSFTTTMATVFAGSQFDLLEESVLRQEVTYTLDGSGNPIYSTGAKATRMGSHVVNITGRKDFFLQRLDTDAATIAGYSATTIYVPSGDATPVENSAPIDNAVLRETQITYADGATIPTITDTVGTTDLATLYYSITNGSAPQGTTTDLSGTVDGQGVVMTFSGTMGTSYPETPAGVYTPIERGTVEAWVYVDRQVDYAGIVHKGEKADFSDEAWSLQFVDARGTVAFAIIRQNPYDYDLVQSSMRLNTKTWYYVAGTWDLDPNGDGNKSDAVIRIYVNGALKGSARIVNAIDGPAVTDGPLVLGSQLLESTISNGFYGFKGKINGVKVSDAAKSAAELLAFYNASKVLTSGW